MTSVLLTPKSILLGGWFGLDGHSIPMYVTVDGWWGWQECRSPSFVSTTPTSSNAFVSSYVDSGNSFTSSAPSTSDTFVSSSPSCQPWILRKE